MTNDAPAPTGSRRVVERLYEKHLDELHRYLVRIGVPPAQACDTCQEAFVRLFLAMQQGQRIQNPRAWLYAVAHNHGLNAIKAGLRAEPLDPRMELVLPTGGRDPEAALLESEKAHRFGRAVDGLPAHQRQCLLLRAEGLRYREIAEILGVSIGTIAAAVSRAIQAIREALHD